MTKIMFVCHGNNGETAREGRPRKQLYIPEILFNKEIIKMEKGYETICQAAPSYPAV